MKDSCCPDQVTDLGRDAVTGYNANPDGTFTPVPAVMCTIPATGGLWVPAADMVWLGTSWSGLLPAELAREAVTPQTVPSTRSAAWSTRWPSRSISSRS